MNRLGRLTLVLVVAVGLLLLAKNVILKFAVTRSVKAIAGLDLRVKDLDVGLLNTHLGVKGLQILNPSGFSEPVMVDMPEIYVDYELGSLFKGKAHLEEVRINLRELVVIRNAQGQVNVNALRPVRESPAKTEPTPPSKTPKTGKPPAIEVDVLQLTIGNVVYKDYSTTPPQVREFPLNVQERFEHITNPYALGSLILTRALTKTTIAQLANIDLQALQSQLTNTVGASVNQVISHVGHDAADVAGATVDEAAGALKRLLGK